MKTDDVALVVKNDSLISEMAKREYFTNKLRELCHLVIQLRKNTHQPNASLEVCVHPHNLNNMAKAVYDVAGFSEGNHIYHVPSLALKIGHSIKKCALIKKGNAI